MRRLALVAALLSGCSAPYQVSHLAGATADDGEAWFLEAGTYDGHSEIHAIHCTPEPRTCERIDVEGSPKRKRPSSGGGGGLGDMGF